MLSAIFVPNSAPRKGILGIDRVSVARCGELKMPRVGFAVRKVLFEKAWKVRMSIGKDGKRIKRYIDWLKAVAMWNRSLRCVDGDYGISRRELAATIASRDLEWRHDQPKASIHQHNLSPAIAKSCVEIGLQMLSRQCHDTSS